MEGKLKRDCIIIKKIFQNLDIFLKIRGHHFMHSSLATSACIELVRKTKLYFSQNLMQSNYNKSKFKIEIISFYHVMQMLKYISWFINTSLRKIEEKYLFFDKTCKWLELSFMYL